MKFPHIEKIDCVLEAIDGKDEFIVANKPGYKVVNYTHQSFETFPEPGTLQQFVRDDAGVLHPVEHYLRECRGMIFDTWTERLVSRPFHKFFNVGEKEESKISRVDFGKHHVVFEKMDGSMIRPFLVGDHVRLGTKMGITETSMQAEEWLVQQDRGLVEQMKDACVRGYTPLFEWVSPDNRIVLEYDEPRLVWLATRETHSGIYVNMPIGDHRVPYYESILDIDKFLEMTREDDSREGYVVAFDDGTRFKVKSDWYVRLHRIKDKTRSEKNLVDTIINNELDDIKPALPDSDRAEVEEFEFKFWRMWNKTLLRLNALGLQSKTDYDGRKDIALNLVPQLNSFEKTFVFYNYDNKGTAHEFIDKTVRNSLSRNEKFNNLKEWMGF